MESRAYTGWELPEAARAQKRVQDFHRKLRNWDQWESEAKREKNSALGGGGGESGCTLSCSSPLTQVLPHPLHPLPAQGSEDPGR